MFAAAKPPAQRPLRPIRQGQPGYCTVEYKQLDHRGVFKFSNHKVFSAEVYNCDYVFPLIFG